MRALCWNGVNDLRVETVADPEILNPNHVILKVRLSTTSGAHAEYVRVPFANTDCFVVPDGVSDEDALFISDAAPTGFMGADFCNIQRGDVVAVWGCGGVGLMAQQSAMILGAERVIAIDR